MWRRNAMIGVLILVPVLVPISNAEDARDVEVPDSLISQHDWTGFEVVLGRITAFHLRGGQHHCSSDPKSPEVPRESISVNGSAASPAFRYERFDEAHTLTIEIVNRSQVEIQQHPSAATDSATLHFVQPARGLLRLTIRDGDQLQTYSARSVWHLLLAEPEVSRRHLVPILTVLRPDWHLVKRVAKIEAELFDERTTRLPGISQRELLAAVSQLDSPQFARRQAADRYLRSLGVALLPYLAMLDPSTLSVEQRLRLRRIRQRLAVPTADTAERAAAWLAHDKAVWLTFLSHQEPSKRKAAASRLTSIHPGIVQFDPFGDEALRRKQIAQLRSRLGMAY